MLTLMAGMAFTSCEWDDDDAIAYTLEGTWKGNMYVNTYYNGNTYYATATEITFLRDPYRYSSGDGYWVDYYSRAPWDYVANHIRWTVNYGRIRVYFVEEGTELEIYDYRLNDNRFTATLPTTTMTWSSASITYRRPTGATIAGATMSGMTATTGRARPAVWQPTSPSEGLASKHQEEARNG